MKIKCTSIDFIRASACALLLITGAVQAANENMPGKPVITFSVTGVQDAEFDDSNKPALAGFKDAEVGYRELTAEFPFLKRDLGDGKLLVGVDYKYTSYDISGGDVKDTKLHAFKVPFTYIRQTQSKKWNYIVRLSPGAHTDGENMSSDDYVLLGIVRAEYLQSQDTTWVVGIVVDRTFGDTKPFPLVGVEYAPNNNWHLGLVLPNPQISYTPSPTSHYFVAAKPGGGKWNVHSDRRNEDYNFTAQGIRTSLGAEFKVTKIGWLRIEAGKVFGQNFEFEDKNGTKVDLDADDAYFATVSFVVHAPK